MILDSLRSDKDTVLNLMFDTDIFNSVPHPFQESVPGSTYSLHADPPALSYTSCTDPEKV